MINSSKIYPILSKMEKNGFIAGEWKVNENNKRVKYYSITDDGKFFLKAIQSHMNDVLNNPYWLEFFKDMTGMEISK
jgi:DNA-binding PadR family transcriptional regulator